MRQKANGQALTLKRLGEAEARAIEMVLDGLPSEHSRRAYGRALSDFFHWHCGVGRPQLNKAVVQRYASELREAGMSASSVNQRLSAIRKLAAEAADNGALDPQVANGIRAVKGGAPGGAAHRQLADARGGAGVARRAGQENNVGAARPRTPSCADRLRATAFGGCGAYFRSRPAARRSLGASRPNR